MDLEKSPVRATHNQENESVGQLDSECSDSVDIQPPASTSQYRIDELREKFDREVPGDFYPENELEDIRKMKAGPEKDTRLSLLKEHLAVHYFGFMSLNDEIHNVAKEIKGGQLVEKVKDLIKEYRKKYHFNEIQIWHLNDLVEELESKNIALTEFFNENHGDGKCMFKALYQVEPLGDIDVLMGPVSVSFICHNVDDFIKVCTNWDSSHEPLTDETKNFVANMAGGSLKYIPRLQELTGTIIGINKHLLNESNIAEVITHEEQHAYNNLFRKGMFYLKHIDTVLDVSLEASPENAYDLVSQYCINAIYDASDRAKDEILAHNADGSSWDSSDIFENLIKTKEEGGAYDYFKVNTLLSEIEKKVAHLHNSKEIIEKAHHILVDSYRKLISQGINAYDMTYANGYNHREIGGIFMQYPLKDWPKISRRIMPKDELFSPRKNEESIYTDHVSYEYPIVDMLSSDGLGKLNEQLSEN